MSHRRVSPGAPQPFDPETDYPLGPRRPDRVTTPAGHTRADLTLDADPRVVAVVQDFTSVGGALLRGGDVDGFVRSLPFTDEQVGRYATRRFTADAADPEVLAVELSDVNDTGIAVEPPG